MRSREILLAAVLVVAGVSGALVAGTQGTDATGRPTTDQLIAPDGESYIWPYTSRTRDVAGRTLGINVVIHGDTDRVRRVFVARSDANWSGIDPEAAVQLSPWGHAHGSVRYTYVAQSPAGPGQWVTPEYQLSVGTYFGERTHVRAYPSPSGDWTALQAHTEYWDWFRLRHTVTGIADGAEFVEQDLRDVPVVEDVTRESHGFDAGYGVGWWTVVEFVPAVLIAGAVVPLTGRRLSGRTAAMTGGLVGVVLAVRAWGLAAEVVLSGADPKLIVALGYPLLAVGPPVLVTLLGRERSGIHVALFAALGLGAGIALDMAVVGVHFPPTRLAFHRLALITALGLVGYGTGSGDRRVVGAGVVAWVAVLAAPLLGVV